MALELFCAKQMVSGEPALTGGPLGRTPLPMPDVKRHELFTGTLVISEKKCQILDYACEYAE